MGCLLAAFSAKPGGDPTAASTAAGSKGDSKDDSKADPKVAPTGLPSQGGGETKEDVHMAGDDLEALAARIAATGNEAEFMQDLAGRIKKHCAGPY